VQGDVAGDRRSLRITVKRHNNRVATWDEHKTEVPVRLVMRRDSVAVDISD
jgi:hypothetical protein